MDDLALERYLAGDCSPDERAAVEAWLDAHPGERALQQLAALRPPPADWRTAEAWQRLSARIGTRPSVQPRARPMRWTRVAAAAAILVAATGTGAYFMRGGRANSSTVTSFTTARGEHREIALKNGAVVVLGPMSELRANEQQGRSDIQLSGTARFRVVHDPARPFVVHARGVETTDLGTQFIVRAYADDPERSVAVTEGRVTVHAVDGAAATVELHDGEIGIADASGAIGVARGDMASLGGWEQGRLTFDNRQLHDVARELMRWFDVDIRIPDQHTAARRVSATYSVTSDAASLQHILDALSESLGVHASTTGRVITISNGDAR